MRISRQSLWLFILAACLMLLPTLIERTEDHSGTILIANDLPLSPPFYHALIFLYNRGLDGAAGIFLNKPLTVAQKARLPDSVRDAGITVDYGGPVDFPDTILVMEKLEDTVRIHNVGGPYDVTPWEDVLKEIPDLAERIRLGQQKGEHRYRVFAGYAGWYPLQLNEEMTVQHSWYTIPPRFDAMFQTTDAPTWESLVGEVKAKEKASKLLSGA